MSNQVVGEIRLFAGDFTPAGWVPCNGQFLGIADNDALFYLIGNTFGREGDTFGIPKLAEVPTLKGGNLRYILSNSGGWPAGGIEAFPGEIRLMLNPSADFLPRNCVRCEGQLVPATDTLRNTLGNRFGGDGITHVGIPQLTFSDPNIGYLLCTQGPPFARDPITFEPIILTDSYLAEVKAFAGANLPGGYLSLEQQAMLTSASFPALFALLGNRFGQGTGSFGTPQLAPLSAGLPFFICTQGIFPTER